MTSPVVVLTLVAPRALEEKLVQTLLTHDVVGATGFSVREIVAYGRSLNFKTVGEQISGRVRQIEAQAVLAADQVQLIIDQLSAEMQGQHVKWRITPVTAAGEIS